MTEYFYGFNFFFFVYNNILQQCFVSMHIFYVEKSKQNAPSWCSYINSVHSFDSFKINPKIPNNFIHW